MPGDKSSGTDDPHPWKAQRDTWGHSHRLRQNSLFDKKASAQLRQLGENSEQVMLDVQGRIRIRDRLLAFARRQSLDNKPVDVNKLVLVGIYQTSRMPCSNM